MPARRPHSSPLNSPTTGEADDTLYVGKGDDGSGNATSVIALAGKGAFVDLAEAQTVGGAKTFSTVPKSSQDASGNTDLVRKSQVDTLLGASLPWRLRH